MRKGTDLNEPAQWLAQFIANCDEDTTYGCDPDKIAIFDLHNYHCKADRWEGDNTFVDQMKADLKTSLATYAPSRSAAAATVSSPSPRSQPATAAPSMSSIAIWGGRGTPGS